VTAVRRGCGACRGCWTTRLRGDLLPPTAERAEQALRGGKCHGQWARAPSPLAQPRGSAERRAPSHTPTSQEGRADLLRPQPRELCCGDPSKQLRTPHTSWAEQKAPVGALCRDAGLAHQRGHPPGQGPGQPAVGDPASAGGLG